MAVNTNHCENKHTNPKSTERTKLNASFKSKNPYLRFCSSPKGYNFIEQNDLRLQGFPLLLNNAIQTSFLYNLQTFIETIYLLRAMMNVLPNDGGHDSFFQWWSLNSHR